MADNPLGMWGRSSGYAQYTTSEQLAFNIAERRIAELPDDLAALIRRDELRDQLDQHGLSAVQEWELRLLEEWPES